jgi:hypothetical protein
MQLLKWLCCNLYAGKAQLAVPTTIVIIGQAKVDAVTDLARAKHKQ